MNNNSKQNKTQTHERNNRNNYKGDSCNDRYSRPYMGYVNRGLNNIKSQIKTHQDEQDNRNYSAHSSTTNSRNVCTGTKTEAIQGIHQ